MDSYGRDNCKTSSYTLFCTSDIITTDEFMVICKNTFTGKNITFIETGEVREVLIHFPWLIKKETVISRFADCFRPYLRFVSSSPYTSKEEKNLAASIESRFRELAQERESPALEPSTLTPQKRKYKDAKKPLQGKRPKKDTITSTVVKELLRRQKSGEDCTDLLESEGEAVSDFE